MTRTSVSRAVFGSVFGLERPLSFTGWTAWFLQAVFLGTTVLLPIAAHAMGWSVFVALPMFWGVMIAGVVYGWKAGLLLGLISPVLNYVLTGMPVFPLLPVMTLELMIYGGLPAYMSERKFRGNLYIATAVAILAGRLVLLAGFVLFIGGMQGLPGWISTRLLPGLPAQMIQIAAVPIAGSLLIRRIRKD